MVSRHVLELCTSPKTLIAALAEEPDQPISKVVKQLFKNDGIAIKQHADASLLKDDADELDLVEKCGSFPHRPSDLFLQIYNDVLHTLDTDPLAGLVSPRLLGSSGVIPLSIVSVIPDIMRHYACLIVRAEAEIILATNYWESSLSSGIVADSLRKLSKRVEARGGAKVVMKLMYDRGNLKQVVKNRIIVNPTYWSRIGLPSEHEIPGVALEVVNYHRPLLGTFHAKYLLVDRRVACLNSNNIQDRPNVEMMVHLEGPIVESIYDMALLSWSNAMNPPLPLLSKPPTYPDAYKFRQDNEDLKYIDLEAMSKATRACLQGQHAVNEAQGAQYDARGLIQRRNSMDPVAIHRRNFDSETEDLRSELHRNTTVPSYTGFLNADTNARGEGTVHGGGNATTGSSRAFSHLAATTPNAVGTNTGSRPQGSDNIAQDDGGGQESVLEEHDASTTSPNGSNFTPMEAGRLPDTRKLDRRATAPDRDRNGDTLSGLRPHILHEPHKPVPIAIVNRSPTGRPGHYHARQNPQDVAWLSAVRYAQRSVFIQTPTFNASPIVSGTLDACRRGVQVTLYLDLGFNDQSETIPFQGGTNEEVVHKMYATLNSEGNGAEKHLEVFWYTARDQTKPLSAAMKKRNCHVKFMAVDGQIAILGSGNHDTQSWFHSQEVNVMVDSPELVSAWLRGLDANQNTRLYGRVSDRDGVWRSKDGEVVQASGVAASGFLKRLKGLGSMIAKVRGSGRF